MDEEMVNIIKSGFLSSDQVLGNDGERRAIRIREGRVPAVTKIVRRGLVEKVELTRTYVTRQDASGKWVTEEVAMGDLSR